MQSLEDFCSTIDQTKLQKQRVSIASYTFKIDEIKDEINLIEGFSKINLFPKMYWSNIEDGSIFGFGSIKELSSPNFNVKKFDNFLKTLENSIISNIESHEMLKVMGGFAFDQFDDRADYKEIWKNFPKTYFFLPEIIISQNEKEILCTLNVDLTTIDSITLKERFQKLQTQIIPLLDSYPKEFQIKPIAIFEKHSFSQSQNQWNENISKIQTLIENSSLEKLVLANTKIIDFSRPIKYEKSLKYLHKSYPKAHIFALEIEKSNIFISATPELLVHKFGSTVKTVALAGSTPRGRSPSEDIKFEKDLLSSDKDLKEHKFVVDQIVRKLNKIGVNIVNSDKPFVVKLMNIQHLKSEIQASSELSLSELIQVLHPTAAVGGVPSDDAIEIIRSIENVSRGWYASPVGWINLKGNGRFVVAIRSAFVTDQKAVLYAGAGIVSDSDAEAEWLETDVKFQPMMKALGVGNNYHQ